MSSLVAFVVLFSTLFAAEAAKQGPPPSNLADAAVLKALCPAKKTCTVLDKWSAGKDASGNDLVFAGVQVLANGPTKKSEEGYDDEPCLPAPYGLIHVKAGRVLSVEPIETLRVGECSYGARGGGESMTFDGKTATYTMERQQDLRAPSERASHLRGIGGLVDSEQQLLAPGHGSAPKPLLGDLARTGL